MAYDLVERSVRKTTVLDVMRRLLQSKNMMVVLPPSAWSSSDRNSRSQPRCIVSSLAEILATSPSSTSFKAKLILPKSTSRSRGSERESLPTSFHGDQPAFRWPKPQGTAETNLWQVALSRRSPYLPAGGPRVSGLLMANHTSISSLFERILKQFDLLIKKKSGYI
eukprot:763916-Hanusia_phi.AAC.11